MKAFRFSFTFVVSLLFLASACTSGLNVNSNNENSSSEESSQSGPKVYVGLGGPAVSVNGVLTSYRTSEMSGGAVNSIFVDENDNLYAAGYYTIPGDYLGRYPAVWINGKLTNLPDDDSIYSEATSVFVSAGIAYVTGRYDVTAMIKMTNWEDPEGEPITEESRNTVAVVWKIGIDNNITKTNFSSVPEDFKMSANAFANSIIVNGEDVYVGGEYNGWDQNQNPILGPAIWKNGQLLMLSSDNLPSTGVKSMLIHGDYLYAGGSEYYWTETESGTYATIWKIDQNLNIESTKISGPSNYGDRQFVNSIFVEGDNIVAGGANTPSEYITHGMVWTLDPEGNVTSENYTSDYDYGEISGVFVHDGNRYAIGYRVVNGASSSEKVVWKNGEPLYSLPYSTTSIFVR